MPSLQGERTAGVPGHVSDAAAQTYMPDDLQPDELHEEDVPEEDVSGHEEAPKQAEEPVRREPAAQPMRRSERAAQQRAASAKDEIQKLVSSVKLPKLRKPDVPLKTLVMRAAIPAAVLALVIFICVAVSNNVQKTRAREALEQSVTDYDTRFCQGVYVDGIDLGGMTQQQAVDAVSANAAAQLSSWSVQLVYEGQTVAWLNADNLHMSVDIADAMNAAWAKGHTGTIDERRAEMDALQETPFMAYTM